MKTFLFALLFAASTLAAQDPILLKNPSFEDIPAQGKTPKGWNTCGFDGETPPDIQPSPNPQYPFFGVTQAPYDGNTYLSIVTRDNDTWESVSSKLDDPLQKGVAYQFSLFLCRSDTFYSASRVTFKGINYADPVVLRIWAGNGVCPSDQLLAQSTPINHNDWREYRFSFVPNENWETLRLEAWYGPESGGWPVTGNILVDYCSAIVQTGAAQPANTEPVFTAAELSAMDAEQLEGYLVWWFEQPRPLKGYSGVVFNVWRFEKTVLEQGLVASIEALSFSEFGALAKDLQSIGAKKTLELIEQVGRIARKPENLRNSEDQAFYLGADDVFMENEGSGSLRQLRYDYIEDHLDAIAKELGRK